MTTRQPPGSCQRSSRWRPPPLACSAIERIAAEQITPYSPGIPAIVPGERITAGLLGYLGSGLATGMQLPDPADRSLQTLRVVART
jgi:arginine/lysine/ornithine decarboxylase